MLIINKQLEKFKDSFGEYFIKKIQDAFPHLYDKNGNMKTDFYAYFDETNDNLLVETRIEDEGIIKDKVERFIRERRASISEEQSKLKMLQDKYVKQLRVMDAVLPECCLRKFTKADCCRTMYASLPKGEKDNAGKVCIIPLEKLANKYRQPKYQLFRVQAGFGVTPTARGNACYGYFCADGERCRWEKYNFFGVGNDEVERIAQELEAVWSDCAGMNVEKEREHAEHEM